MPAYRCSFCNINYPPYVAFRLCPNCDEAISYFTNVQDDSDWRKLLEMKRSGIELPDRDKVTPPETDAATVVYDATTDLMKVHDRDFAALNLEPEPFDVVKLNGNYYEVLERAAGGFWNVERIDVYEWLAELDAWSGEPHEGFSSDDIRQIELPDGTKMYWDPRIDGGP